MFAEVKANVISGVQLFTGFVLLGLSMLGIGTFYGFVRPPVTEVKVPVPVEVPEPEFTFALAMKMADQMRVERAIATVLLHHEGAGRFSGDSKRCEKSDWWRKKATQAATKLAKAGKIHRWEQKAQIEAMMCSYGPGQVAGWWAPELAMVWSDLTNLKLNAWAAFSVWKRYEAEVKKANPKAGRDTVIRLTFRSYNGSGPDAEAYADARMKELSALKTRGQG